MDKTQQLIDKLINAISFKFKEDGTSPNLTISRLPHGYYCSVVRYPNSSNKYLATKKKVVCKAPVADTLEKALWNVATAFLTLAMPKPNPLQELENIIQSSDNVIRNGK